MASDDTATPPLAVSRCDAFTARRMVRALASDVPRHEVDDIAQEVLCALAFRREPKGAHTGRTAVAGRAAFLRHEAARQLAEHERRRARLHTGDALAVDVLPPPVTPSAEDLSLAFAPIGTLRRALAQLQEDEPAAYVVLDLALDGEPMAAAAAVLGIPLGTACTWLRHARVAVRALFEREARGERRAAVRGLDRSGRAS